MPELPEVETVRGGLAQLLPLPLTIRSVIIHRRDLRIPVPAGLEEHFAGRQLLAIERRAKYLLWRCSGAVLISHLGMTGSWRRGDAVSRRHDHVEVVFTTGERLVYHDPRRFGLLAFANDDALDSHPLLAELGPEPLGPDFTTDWLADCCRGSKAPIKNRIMSNAVVVGVGNIYAAESLFRAGIRPDRAAGRISRKRLARLVDCIRKVLTEAIAAGGSTISDFRQAGGSSGYFQHNFQVYGRQDQPCTTCGATLRHQTLGGRATVFCPRCQR